MINQEEKEGKMESKGEIVLISYRKEELLEMIEGAIKNVIDKIKLENEGEQYLSREEAAKLCSVTVQTLNNWVNSGRLISHRINGRVLYKRSDIDNALTKRKVLRNTSKA